LSSIREEQKSKILKAVRREEETHLNEAHAKSSTLKGAEMLEMRTALMDYMQEHEERRQRERQKQLEMPSHLRTGTNPLTNGAPSTYLTESVRAASLPIKMAVDPKWSTELKKTNNRVGIRAEYERRLSASVTGSIAPELPHMYPKRYLSSPPTPYFVPGQKS